MYRQIAENKRTTVGLLFLILGVVGGISVLVNLIFDDRTGFWGVSLFVVLISAIVIVFFYTNKTVVKMMGGVEVTKAEYPTLVRIVENLSITAGIPVPKIVVMDNDSINAFAAGSSPEKAVVGVTTGALKYLTKEELEGVMAHEIAHVRNYDTRVSVVVYAVAIVFLVLGEILIRSRGRKNPLPIVGLVLLLIGYPIVTLLRLAVSREREFLADASSVELTRFPEGLQNALRKIESQGEGKALEPAASHMMFSNKPAKFFKKLLSTHPPVEERVARLDKTFTGF